MDSTTHSLIGLFYQLMPTAVTVRATVVIPILMIAQAVRKIRKKLAGDSDQTLWACINEVGGHLVAGCLLLGLAIVLAIAHLLGDG